MTEVPEYAEIPLYEYHGEYLHMLHNAKWRPGFARSFLVIDFFQAQEMGIRVNLDELPSYIKEKLDSWNDGAEMFGGFLFLVHGTLEDHRQLFDEMLAELIMGPQGADDDTFDYWPGACECLEMYATQLFERTQDKHYKKALKNLTTANQDVPEWEGVMLRCK